MARENCDRHWRFYTMKVGKESFRTATGKSLTVDQNISLTRMKGEKLLHGTLISLLIGGEYMRPSTPGKKNADHLRVEFFIPLIKVSFNNHLSSISS